MGGMPRLYGSYRLVWLALDLIFPPQCAGCGKPGTRWCSECQGQVRQIQGDICPKCGDPQRDSRLCAACRASPPSYECLRSWAAFDGPVREAIHRLKYKRDMALGDTLAAQSGPILRALGWPIELVTPVPLSQGRHRERGYNQAGLIARPLALALGLKYAPHAVSRWRETRSQVGLTGEQRRQNVRGAFRIEGAEVRGRSILLVDDVATTGSTLSSAAEALLAGGAGKVYAFTVARA
jgi:ComF family protein